MCLKDVGRIAFPKYLASFLDNVLREIPAVTVPVHAHLQNPLISRGIHFNYKGETHCLDETHHKAP